jgi:hypothetical protein
VRRSQTNIQDMSPQTSSTANRLLDDRDLFNMHEHSNCKLLSYMFAVCVSSSVLEN